jgi:protease-4
MLLGVRAMRVACAVVIAFGVASCGTPAAASGLGDYRREAELLVDTPGTTSSAAGGFFNPASWAVQPGGGLFLAWDDVARGDGSQFAAALSLRHLGFGVRQWNATPPAGGDSQLRDYTLGIGGGTRAHAWGLAYGWGGGDLERQARHERLVLGSIYRARWGSLGSATTWDLERRDHQVQVDVGLRPLGPRLTLFGDAVYRRGESFEDIRTGYGLEARVLPGLAVAGKVQSDGEVSVRAGVALDRHSWLGTRAHLDDGGRRDVTTYAVDFGAAHADLGLRLAPRRFPELSLRRPLAYQRYRLLDRRPTLAGTLGWIDAQAAEPDVRGALVDLSGAQFSAAAAWELRAQLAGLRAAGKRVLVSCDRPGMYQLLVASVADEVWLHPAGLVDASGLASGRTYMRRALDKLGLGVDEWRFFTYKSAFESYSRDSMSEPDRQQRQELIDDFYDVIAGAIGAGRRIDRARFDALVDSLVVLRPEEAQAFGLVDSIGDFAAMRRAAPRAARRDGWAGEPAAMLGDLVVDRVWREEAWGEAPHISLLYAIGPCEMDSGIRGRTLARAVRSAADDRRVRAIVLRVDSPGGDPLPSELVAHELRAAAARKPVIVSQGQVAASGGYWISMDADTILTTPLTITGSIGVIGGWIWNAGLGDKIGFDYDGVQHGAHADLQLGIRLPVIEQTLPDRQLRPAERERVETLVRATYDDFLTRVAAARGMSKASVDAIAQGRVWSGRRALERGLVDRTGGLWDGLRLARDAAGLGPDRVVRIVQGPGVGWFDMRGLQRRLLAWAMRDETAAGEGGAAAVEASATLASWLDPAQPATGRSETLWLSPVERAFLNTILRHNGRPLVLLPPLDVRDGGALR